MPSLIVLDIHLPDGNGLDFLRELRKQQKTSNVPVIALTVDKEDNDLVAGFASGCDDYLPKPYNFDVLYARIEGLLRRAWYSGSIHKGALTLDILRNKAFVNGRNAELTPKEFAVLLFLVQNEGKELTAEAIYEHVWGTAMNIDSGAVRRHISMLKKKLDEENAVDFSILTEYGRGYTFTTD